MTSILAKLRPSAGPISMPISVRCLPVKLLVYSVESGQRPLPRPLRRHLDGCLNCQAEMARERQLIRSLGALAGDLQRAPKRLESIAFRASPSGHVVEASRSRWVVGATLASVSAGAVGVALVVGRRLRTATA